MSTWVVCEYRRRLVCDYMGRKLVGECMGKGLVHDLIEAHSCVS